VLAGRRPAIQLNIDATRMSQAFSGNSYIQNIVTDEVTAFGQGHPAIAALTIELRASMRT